MLLSCRDAAAAVATPDYIRLHVIAASDAAEDQAIKLRVRDACLDYVRAIVADCRDADEAWAALNDRRDALFHAVEEGARGVGAEDVRCELGVFDFPDRVYGDALVPAGSYRALRVVIGAGEGRNWWCVLYPSLCYPEDYKAGEPVRFYSAIWNWLRRLFGGGAS